MLPERLLQKRLEDCTPDEVKQKLGWSFARQAFRDGLDTILRKGSYDDAGKRLFGEHYSREVKQCIVDEIRALTDVGTVYTVSELAELLTLSTPTDFNNSIRKLQIEQAIDRAAGWQRAPARVCPLTRIEVRQVWSRTA